MAGMMAGMSSPARPWFQLGTPDKALSEFGPVKRWLSDVRRIMLAIYAGSNFYDVLAQVYFELGVFGTAPMAIYEDFKDVIRCQQFTVGSYFLAANGHGFVDSFFREYQLQVSQVVTQFQYENCSVATRNNWDNGTTEAWVDIIHVVEPNDNRDSMSIRNRDMPVRSVYYEKSEHENKFLRESGFAEFPIMSPRWDVNSEDVYATDCPGMTALGDSKALQIQEKKKAQALDKLIDPPLQAPSEMRGRRVSLIPGEVSYVDQRGAGTGISSIYDIKPDFNAILADIEKTEFRVKAAFFEDLFLMFANVENRERVTAEEIIRKHEEKLLMLGPMLERTQHELFDPATDRTFNIGVRAGMFPDPPPELSNTKLTVEYLGPLFQAQRSVATTAIDRMATFVSNLATIAPSAIDKFDGDQAVDEYSEALGISPRIILTDDEVEEVRLERERMARVAQAAAAAEPAKDATQAVKNLADAGATPDSALAGLQDAIQQTNAP